jgi:hypothetical protein
MPALDSTQYPVFVVGAARSGISAVAQRLLKCGEYQAFEEGHFLWMLRRFVDTLHETGWSVAQITAFRCICGPMMAAFAYSYTQEYFAAPVTSVSVS